MEQSEQSFDLAQELYRNGDFARAFHLYLELANKGRVGCQRFVGWMYMFGEGTNVDLTRAYEWFEKASASGDGEAMFGAGRVCLLGKRDEEALNWFKRACDLEFTPACYRLGWMSMHGRGCGKDLNKAYELFQDAYAKGHLPAGRAIARLMIGGHFGLWRRFLGIGFFIRFLAAALIAAARDPKSQRFMV